MGWRETDTGCRQTADEVRDLFHNAPTSTYKYKVELRCHIEQSSDDCYRPIACYDPPDTDSYSTYRALRDEEPAQWEFVGLVCLGDPGEVTAVISTATVTREFRRLIWPQANLVIQPPGGETLVNLVTIFHTPDTDPVTQSVTLLGQRVELEATPTTWTWHWAQPHDHASDTSHQAHTTTDPGAAYPSKAITHTYTRADTTVHPSLDVTYTGRFRLNNGPWQDIPENHTVSGTPQPLTILQARPGLVR